MLDAPATRAAFVAAMQTPAPYAARHAVVLPVRLVETHVSWVFLTGPYAYKVKKPLRLSFLDYSTAARRKAFCHEELRLNRRHAPGLYVDVVGIGGTPTAPCVGAPDGAFEHALCMRQFDPQLELTPLLARGAVDGEEIGRLGADLAQMHVAAQRADAASGHGRPDRLHRVTLDNFDAIRSGLADATGCTRLDELQRDLDASFAGVADTMERRRRDGFVRECHGDLHCGNVVRWQGRLVAFDGLEFDPALRFIDVANDIAFLTMDLAAHGRSELRHALLETWTAASGDYAAVALLPYYERYRALVRAKVAVLRGGQSAEASVESQRSARQYLAWASARGQPHRPRLVVMVGLSGSGKTWLARRLATACEALHLRSDVERKRLAGLGPLDDSRSPPDGGLYTREFGERTYARLRECAHSCLAGGANVIVDAANLRHDERSGFLRLGQEFGADVRLVHCHAPLATLKQRVAMRRTGTADASEATVELLDRQPGYWEPFDHAERPLVRRIDTGDAHDVERLVAELRRSDTTAP